MDKWRLVLISIFLLYVPLVISAEQNCHYDQRNRFEALLTTRCPLTNSEQCLDDSLDNLTAIRYRCHGPRQNETLQILHANEMMTILRSKDTSCLISLFYAPDCPFSSRLAPFFNALPQRFPKLAAVAVDASDFSKFNSRYGITGTPTIILWVNGMAVARMDERPLNSEGLSDFIRHWTDLEPVPGIGQVDGPLELIINPNADLKYLILAWTVLISGSAYYYLKSDFAQRVHNHLQRIFGGV